MGSAAIVEIEIPVQCLSGDGNSVIAVQLDLFVLHRFSEAFDKDVIPPAALAIPAELNFVLLKHADKR